MATASSASRELVCVECGERSDDPEFGWRLYRADEEHEAPQLVSYCPECADREFGCR